MRVERNPRLADVRLPALTIVRDLRGLASLRHVSALQLANDPALTSLDGLEPLTELVFDLELDGNPALTSIAALRDVTVVGHFQMISNHALSDLTLPSLTSITSSLIISDMKSLDSLASLASVRSVTGDITFFQNDLLPDAEIAAFLAQVGRERANTTRSGSRPRSGTRLEVVNVTSPTGRDGRWHSLPWPAARHVKNTIPRSGESTWAALTRNPARRVS